MWEQFRSKSFVNVITGAKEVYAYLETVSKSHQGCKTCKDEILSAVTEGVMNAMKEATAKTPGSRKRSSGTMTLDEVVPGGTKEAISRSVRFMKVK